MIRGTFKQPAVGPALGPVAARVGAAIGLGALAGPLALLPLIDFGGASDVDCKALIEQARVNTATTERIARPNAGKTSKAWRGKLAREKARDRRPTRMARHCERMPTARFGGHAQYGDSNPRPCV